MRYLILSSVFFVAAPAFASDLPPGVPPSAVRTWHASVIAPESVRPGSLIDSQGGGAIPALPIEPQIAGNVRYLSGGIGDEELSELKSDKHNYNTHVLMNEKSGAYISNVAVNIKNSNGDVMNVGGAGPYLYFSLPPGHYTLAATSPSGERRVRQFTVPKNGSANLHLVFRG